MSNFYVEKVRYSNNVFVLKTHEPLMTNTTAPQSVVDKWTFIHNWHKEDPDNNKLLNAGALNCAYCELYEGPGCEDCPVDIFTGGPSCTQTPYIFYFKSTKIEDLIINSKLVLDIAIEIKEKINEQI